MSLEGIAFFIVDKMSAYVVGGSNPQTAARFTRGEMEAIYKGNHRSRDSTGQWRVTPPPEPLPITAAMNKADSMIAEILQSCKEPEPRKAPEMKPQEVALNGFDKMAAYAKGTV